jgi:hypothetical protein
MARSTSSSLRSVGAAAINTRVGSLHGSAPVSGELGVEFVFAFFLAQGIRACGAVHLKAILCITRKKLIGFVDVHAS